MPDLRELVLLALIAAMCFAGGYFFAQGQQPVALAVQGTSVQPVFSPGAGPGIVALMDSAKTSIHAELYEFSYPALREALVLAAERGVDVKLLLEPSISSNVDTATFLKAHGVLVRWTGGGFRLTHAKSAVVDSARVLVGSINWSSSAMQRNREAGVLVTDEGVAEEFESVFASDWQAGTEVK